MFPTKTLKIALGLSSVYKKTSFTKFNVWTSTVIFMAGDFFSPTFAAGRFNQYYPNFITIVNTYS